MKESYYSKHDYIHCECIHREILEIHTNEFKYYTYNTRNTFSVLVGHGNQDESSGGRHFQLSSFLLLLVLCQALHYSINGCKENTA